MIASIYVVGKARPYYEVIIVDGYFTIFQKFYSLKKAVEFCQTKNAPIRKFRAIDPKVKFGVDAPLPA